MTQLQKQALILMQALLGVVSSNFRMVWITVDCLVTVHIILEETCAEDEEEIEDLMSEFEALQNKSINYEFKTYVSNEDIVWPELASTIVVYRRRES